MGCGCGGHHDRRHGGRHDCGPRHWGPRHGGHHHGGSCGCGRPYGFRRHFWTEEERIAWLEQYLEDLREEAKAVEEQISAMKGAG